MLTLKINALARVLSSGQRKGVVASDMNNKLKGKHRVKARSEDIKLSESEKAVGNRLIFKDVRKMSKRTRYVLCYPNLPEWEKPYHRFMSLNRPYFTDVDTETQTVMPEYERLQFSEGDLMPPGGVTVTYSEEHALAFSVPSSSRDIPGCQATDVIRAVVLVTEAAYTLAVPLELGTRGEGGMLTEQLEQMWQKENLHVYTFAESADGTDASATLHLNIE